MKDTDVNSTPVAIPAFSILLTGDKLFPLKEMVADLKWGWLHTQYIENISER